APPPVQIVKAQIGPDPADFGTVPAGLGSDLDITIENTGNAAYSLGQALIRGEHWSDFRIIDDRCSNRSLPAGTCAIRVSFVPVETGLHESALVISGASGQLGVRLRGNAAPPPKPVADLSPGKVDLTRKDVDQPISLRNSGDGNLIVNVVRLEGKE